MMEPSETLKKIAQSSAAPGAESNAQGVVEIVCADVDAMLAFYGLLGFWVERKTGPFAILNGYGMRIFVVEEEGAPSVKRWTNIRVIVADVDLIWASVNSLALPIVNSIGDRYYGLRDFVLADPSGFEIRFAQIIGDGTSA